MSSDSEDDCYGNVAQQLQKMKNNYQDDKIETTNLLEESINDSAELDEILQNCAKTAKRRPKQDTIHTEDNSNSSLNDLPDVSPAPSAQKTRKRVTRSSAKSGCSNDLDTFELPKTRSKRKKTAASSSAGTSTADTSAGSSNTDDTASNMDDSSNTASFSRGGARGRGRGRGRGKTAPKRPKGRRGGRWGHHHLLSMMDFISALMPLNCDASVPTYSVGNTEEYYDQSEQQALFTNQPKKTDDVIVVEDNVLDENEELSVKVYWQSSEFFKFTIRKYQKINSIFDYFSKKENVTRDKVLLTFNDKILKPDDTPDAIGYSIVKFIDGGIVNKSVVQLANKEDHSDGIKLKFQCQNLKKPLELSVRPTERLSVVMMKCAERLEVPLDRLRFEFDGDLIPGKATATDLELEGGECIDVKILS